MELTDKELLEIWNSICGDEKPDEKPEDEYVTYARDCDQYAEPSMDNTCDY